MKHDTPDLEKQRAALEHARRQAQNDMQAAKDQHFYTRLGLTEPETDTPEDRFVISIHCDRWTHDNLEAGETNDHEIEFDHASVDTDELVRHGREYGFSEPSCNDPQMSPEVWFRSTFPREDRAYFEQGVQKYYSLHIHEVNGKPPSPEDYQRVADLIGTRFDQALTPPYRGEQEGPDLCL